MQFKSVSLLVLLLGLVALVQGAAVATRNYKPPCNVDTCKSQCHSALKPLTDKCNSAYPPSNSYGGNGGGHYARDNHFDLNQSVDITAIYGTICLSFFTDGCHFCFFEVSKVCVQGYTKDKWDVDYFNECVESTVADCVSTNTITY